MTAFFALRTSALVLGATLLLTIASSAAAQYAYSLERYQHYVSNGPWWVHASATNNTTSSVTWRVSYSSRRCSTWSGALSLVRAANSSMGYDSCQTSSGTMSRQLAPYTSAALMRRDVTKLNYFRVQKFDRLSGRLLETGYATERDTFQEFAFSAHY